VSVSLDEMSIGPSKYISLWRKYQRTKSTTQKFSNVKNELLARNLVDSDTDSVQVSSRDETGIASRQSTDRSPVDLL
jgi:hypothetical protein